MQSFHGNAATPPPRFRMGVFFYEKKRSKFFPEFTDLARDVGVDAVPIDLDRALEAQGPFDVIMHKLTHELAAEVSTGERNARVAELEEYVRAHPGVLLVNETRHVRTVMDRASTHAVLSTALANGVVPRSVIVREHPHDYEAFLAQEGLVFPLITKPLQACGSDFAHKHAFVKSVAALRTHVATPFLLQQYIAHSGKLSKVYVVGDHVECVERPSLDKATVARGKGSGGGGGAHTPPHGEDIEWFSSAVINYHWDESGNRMRLDKGAPHDASPTICTIAKSLSEALHLTLFGFDVLVDEVTGKHYVIDINYFPGYTGVRNFYEILLAHVIAQYEKHVSQ